MFNGTSLASKIVFINCKLSLFHKSFNKSHLSVWVIQLSDIQSFTKALFVFIKLYNRITSSYYSGLKDVKFPGFLLYYTPWISPNTYKQLRSTSFELVIKISLSSTKQFITFPSRLFGYKIDNLLIILKAILDLFDLLSTYQLFLLIL